jgi:uncharacterized protein with NAD-binding domain and iron-sulfur cluster
MGSGDLSRRELIRDATVAGAGLALAGPAAATAGRRRPRRSGRTVAVLGGGMAGLAAAHELAERGFGVTVYEPTALGGKARSIGVPRSSSGGRRPLPGEHGFRFFPGFYHHVPDTMRRVPFPGNPNGVWDNLVDVSGGRFVRSDGRPDSLIFGFGYSPEQAMSVDGLRRLLTSELVEGKALRPDEAAYFVERLLVFLTSSDERRYGQWEHVSWWDFVGAESRSREYQHVAARSLTRALVAAKERTASTRTIGNMGEAFVMNIMGRGNDGALDRVLDLPTNEAWIDPWVALLRKLGVRFRPGQTIEALEMKGGRVVSARARDRHGRRRRVEADWFVCAMPAERARRLWGRKVLAADPSLAGMNDLFVDWMVGIQYYLKRPVNIVRGHITFLDSPWALTALTQAQFWADRDFRRDYGDGSVVDCLSVDVSDWDTPGILYGKPAKLCTRPEVAAEVWAQMKSHLEDTGEAYLPSDVLHSWFLDPGVRWHARRRRNSNATPLLVNTVGSWEKRPKAHTKIPNLFLSGDYVQTDLDLATMEGANESARAAVNALLERSGSSAQPAQMFKLYDPPEFEGLKAIDAERFRAGQPNLLDV